MDKNIVIDNTNDMNTRNNVFLKVSIFDSSNKIKFISLIKIIIYLDSKVKTLIRKKIKNIHDI